MSEADLGLSGAMENDYALSTFSGDLDNCFGPKAERQPTRGRSLGSAAAAIATSA